MPSSVQTKEGTPAQATLAEQLWHVATRPDLHSEPVQRMSAGDEHDPLIHEGSEAEAQGARAARARSALENAAPPRPARAMSSGQPVVQGYFYRDEDTTKQRLSKKEVLDWLREHQLSLPEESEECIRRFVDDDSARPLSSIGSIIGGSLSQGMDGSGETSSVRVHELVPQGLSGSTLDPKQGIPEHQGILPQVPTNDVSIPPAALARTQKNIAKDTTRFDWDHAKDVGRGVSGAKFVDYTGTKGDKKRTVTKKYHGYTGELLSGEPATAWEVARANLYRFYAPDTVSKTYLTTFKDDPMGVSMAFEGEDFDDFLNRLTPEALEALDLKSFMKALFVSVFLGERDLKPANLFLTSEGKSKRIDFGHTFEVFEDLQPVVNSPIELVKRLCKGHLPRELANHIEAHEEECQEGIDDAIRDILEGAKLGDVRANMLARFDDIPPKVREKIEETLVKREKELRELEYVRTLGEPTQPPLG